MTLGPSARDGEIEAFVVDRYLESLLARAPRDPSDIPADLRATADLLVSGLPRYHPSFRFVEALAARLASVSGREAAPGEVIEFPEPGRMGEAVLDARPPGQVRPVVIGGMLIPAAISLAGAAAWVAWRRGRATADPMTRAIRAVARARLV